MVDRMARNRLASLVRQLSAGKLTTARFQLAGDQLCSSTSDHVVPSMFEVVDGLYHDLWSYRLRGKHRLDARARRVVARVVLFLRSDAAEVSDFQGPKDGPLGWRDVVLMFAAIVCLLLLTAEFGFVGVILGVLSIGCSLWHLHRRELAWRAENDRLIDLQTTWPFPDVGSLRRARTRPVFLTGNRTSTESGGNALH